MLISLVQLNGLNKKNLSITPFTLNSMDGGIWSPATSEALNGA